MLVYANNETTTRGIVQLPRLPVLPTSVYRPICFYMYVCGSPWRAMSPEIDIGHMSNEIAMRLLLVVWLDEIVIISRS